MTNMMLGTFSNGIGVNAAPYIFHGRKTGTTETSFNKDLSGPMGNHYTPDAVISRCFQRPMEVIT